MLLLDPLMASRRCYMAESMPFPRFTSRKHPVSLTRGRVHAVFLFSGSIHAVFLSKFRTVDLPCSCRARDLEQRLEVINNQLHKLKASKVTSCVEFTHLSRSTFFVPIGGPREYMKTMLAHNGTRAPTVHFSKWKHVVATHGDSSREAGLGFATIKKG